MKHKHQKCDGSEDCVVVPNLPAQDIRYHNVKGNEHCSRCGVFWSRKPPSCTARKEAK